MDIEYLSDAHQRALSAIGHALILRDEPDAWLGLGTVFQARLTPYERACLLSSVAVANDPKLMFEVIDAVAKSKRLGCPLPVLLDIEDEARWWAECATLPELKAWATACYLRLPEHEKTGFLAAAQRRAVA